MSAPQTDMSEINNVRLRDNLNVLEEINTIIREKDTDDAFFVLEVDDIIKKVDTWRQLMPRVGLHYAVKCNNHPALLTLLADLAVSFDCASQGEIEAVTRMEVNARRIIYAHPCKQISQLKYAQGAGVSLMTVDNASELHKIKIHYSSAQLVVRIRFDDPTALHCLGEKYGIPPNKARDLLSTARDLKLQVVGVAFHVGSDSANPNIFYRAIAAAKKVFDVAKEEGFDPYFLDIGGGFPGDDNNLMKDQAKNVNKALAEFFPEDGKFKVIGEPGRYVVSSAYTLATTIVSSRPELDDDGSLVRMMYYTNDGVHMSFGMKLLLPTTFSAFALKGNKNNETVPSLIWGQALTNKDIIAEDISLPLMSTGDWLVWPDMGAYTIAFASNFNGFEKLEVFVVSSFVAWSKLGRIRDTSGKDDKRCSANPCSLM